MSYNSLAAYYHVMFALHRHHKYSIQEIENMLPFERDIFLEMVVSAVEDEKKELESS